MSSKSAKILLTGLPGCGKTTVIKEIIEYLDSAKIAGFYTEEIREDGKRKGFYWTRLDGPTGTLAHIDIKGPHKVGKYGVNVTGFEKDVVPVLNVEQPNTEIFIIDEIGKMECLSQKFVTAIRRLFVCEKSILATVAKKGTGLISEVKQYPGVKLFNLNPANREAPRSGFDHIQAFGLVAEILRILS